MTIPTRLRQRDILSPQLASCQCVDSGFSRGAVAPLRWLATAGPGLLTGAAAAHRLRGIVHKFAAAEEIVHVPPVIGREYARGVEHALPWAGCATSGHPPGPRTDAGSEATRTVVTGGPSTAKCWPAPHIWAECSPGRRRVARSPRTCARLRRTHA
jgi:hypothetical protein